MVPTPTQIQLKCAHHITNTFYSAKCMFLTFMLSFVKLRSIFDDSRVLKVHQYLFNTFSVR